MNRRGFGFFSASCSEVAVKCTDYKGTLENINIQTNGVLGYVGLHESPVILNIA